MNKSEIFTRSDTIADRIPEAATSALVNEVFCKMNQDDIGMIAREDNLIVRLGNMWMEKNIGNKLKRAKYTSQIMRMVARLLYNIRKETNTDLDLSEYIKPCFFDDIARATMLTAGRDATDDEHLETPSNAIKLGHDIKRIVNIKIGLAIMLKDHEAEADGERFLRLMNVFWGTRVTKLARNTLVERQFNKRQVLPDTNDIQKLNEYMNTQLSNIDLEEISLENYNKVARLVAAKLLQYNRRRPGEIEAITLEDYGARVSGTSESRTSMFGVLTTFERKLMEKQDVLTTRGKGHRGVPILIPDVAKAGIAYVASSHVRESVGVSSRYLFATVGSDFRLYECLAQHCEEADLSYPQRVTATTLRKYMATITQALDLKPHQIEWVMRHMGHSLDVHKIYYRSTSDIIERTQVAKILLLQDTGRLDEFANQSLEDIQLSDLAEESTPEDVPMEELFIASEEMDEDIHDSQDPTETGQPAKKTNSAVTRKIWTTEEEEEIRQLFNKNFEERKRPTPAQCLKAIRKSKNNGGVIQLRKKDVLKKKVYRMIDNLEK